MLVAKKMIEVWTQVIGTDSYKHFKTGEKMTKSKLSGREKLNKKIIRMEFVEGKTIL